MKREFCLNSRRWIEIMGLKGQPPNSCPYKQEQFLHCENCGYYILKEETNYIKRFLKSIRRNYE